MSSGLPTPDTPQCAAHSARRRFSRAEREREEEREKETASARERERARESEGTPALVTSFPGRSLKAQPWSSARRQKRPPNLPGVLFDFTFQIFTALVTNRGKINIPHNRVQICAISRNLGFVWPNPGS